MAEAPVATAGDDDQLDEKALAALIKATGGRRGSTGQKKQICADCGGVITTLLLSGGEYADGCDTCWKANGYEGDPPCNLKKSQFQQKAQKQMEKAQRRRDQKTPAEVQAEKLQFARQQKLEELKAKSPLKQALVSLIQHIEDQSLSELELFHEIDQNGDGILTRGEMAAALRRLACPLSPSELDGVLRCFDADNSGSIDFAEFYQLLREESHWIEQREITKEDPRLCGFAIGDRVRLKCRLFSDLSKASLLKDDFQVTAGKVMGPGKKQGIITIDLDKGGGEMTVKAELLQKLTATKGHHHGCLCEVCFIECYGTDYFGYPPDDEENPYEPQSPRSAQSPSGGMSPMSAGRSGFSPGSSPRSPASPVRKTFPRQCHQDAYGQNLVAQIAGEKLWLLFPPSSTWLGQHRLPYEDSSTFTDVDPLIQLPPGCTGVGAILKPGDVLAVPRHWFHAVECMSNWSLSVNQWLDAAGDEEQRVHEAVARCLATPLVEARPENWWLNPDEELLETSDNLEFLASALQVASDDDQGPPVEAVQAALLRAATHPEVVSLIVRRVKEDLAVCHQKLRPIIATIHKLEMLHSCLGSDCRTRPCTPLAPPSRSGRQQGATAWARLRVRESCSLRSSASALGLFAPFACQAFLAGRRRSRCIPTRHRHPRLRLFSSVISEEQQTASEVLVDFQTFWRWIVLLERRRQGTRVLRTYREIGRRVKTIMRRLRARGVEVCFLTASGTSDHPAGHGEEKDAMFRLAEEQVEASLGDRCVWRVVDQSPSELLERLVKDKPLSAVVGDVSALFARAESRASVFTMARPRRPGALDVLGSLGSRVRASRALSFGLAGILFALSLSASEGFGFLGPRRTVLTSLAAPLVAPGVAWAESLELKSPKSIKELAAGSKKLEDALRLGRPVVVDFSAAWCGDCKAMAPKLQKIREEASKEVEFVTLDVSFAGPGQDMPSTFPYDKDTDRWARKFKVDGLPHVALVDSSHRVQTALVGDVPYDIMQADVEALRKGKEVPFVMYDAFKNKPSNDILAN
ncbi:hspbap1 [Symbiodinium sp. KB8]|nr:hspbap1 [Symbiodinium sp. KB8]